MAIPYPNGTFQGTLFFHAPDGKSGWSEVYWFYGITNYEDLLVALQDVATARLALLTSAHTLVYKRISDMGIRGDAYIDGVNEPGTFGDTETESLPASSCVLMREFNSSYRSSYKYLHGVPEGIQNNGLIVESATTTSYLAALSSFFDVVIENTWMMLKNDAGTMYNQNEIIEIAYSSVIRNHKVGRPFGLSRGRSKRCPTGS